MAAGLPVSSSRKRHRPAFLGGERSLFPLTGICALIRALGVPGEGSGLGLASIVFL